MDAGARKLEFSPAIGMRSPAQVDVHGRCRRERGADRPADPRAGPAPRVVHELEKAYVHDERFEMNLAELRGLTESLADLIEQRNVALTR